MSKAPIWPVATDALIADTTHLSTEEFGAYVLLMIAQWRSNGAPLPADESRLSRMARLSQRAWERARPVLVELFEVDADGWRQKRVEKDLVGVIEKIEANRANGSLGGKAKILKLHNPALANATNSPPQTGSETVAIHEPYPEPEKKEGSSSADADPPSTPSKPKSERRTYPEAFEAFWRDYPTDELMSKKRTHEVWKKLAEHDQEAARAAVPSFRAYCQKHTDYRPVHAERFLSQRRFDGFLAKQNDAYRSIPAAPDWGVLGRKLSDLIGAPAFAQWFGGGSVQLVDGNPVRVIVDKEFRRNWITKNYSSALAQAFGADVVIECANNNKTSDRRAIR